MNLPDEINKLCEAGDIDRALTLEAHAYDRLVKPVEDEAHYFKCFRQWQGAFEVAAQNNKWVPATGPRVGFVVHSDAPMAHTRCVIKHCELRPKGSEAVVFVMGMDTGLLRQLFAPFGVKVCYLSRGNDGVLIMLYRMRELMKSLGVGTLVWVSLPIWASYAFATRLAYKQVFWALRFHPVVSPYIDLYITPGKRSEKTRIFNGQTWKVAHCPLMVEMGGVGGQMVSGFNHRPAYGTIGREEKIAHPQFMESVRGIMNEGCFYWTGKRYSEAVQEALQDVTNAFKGWVDPKSFISQLDIYLETHPLGGMCSQVAWELGKPVIALDNPHSTYGSLEYPGLAKANNINEYIELAKKAKDKSYAQSVIQAQYAAMREEDERAGEDVARWWEMVSN